MADGQRVGLIGCGTWGRNILRDLRGLGAEVVVIDPDDQARTRAGEIGASAVRPGLGDLPKVDGVVVATPATTHAEVVEALLDRAMPIFCEKPFTTDSDSARRLCEAGGDRIHLMHLFRYHPGVEALGELARSDELGRVHGVRSARTNWTSPRVDTDSTWTMLPHDLTLAIEILGLIPEPQAALAERLDGRAVGIWALCGGPHEPWLVVEGSNRFAEKRREVRVHGEDAVAVLSRDDAPVLRIESGTGLDADVEERPVDPAPALRRELEAFLDHLAGGSAPKSTADEGVEVVLAIERLRELAGLPS